ncbi:MFS transporter [Phycicoccus sonneratiae]|uniref:MFS transporter n=1 Tax=Phycicoccus sonneratiae TaxID=2807628 RepID=A0ABS2CT09_9MICO|nr:MFS transporter [Phycicoccus sonneraticus]MBM6402598.1 MFS transporter [Phycicoccus sonneraticus]
MADPAGAAAGFRRDRVTWTLYALLAWFAYLQAVPGLVVPRLRAEMGFGYTVGGLHVAAFAAGATLAGAVSARAERHLGRTRLLWASSGVMALGAALLTLGRQPAATVGAIAVMGVGGGLLLATVQVGLAEHHAARPAVALTEANVAAAASYLLLAGTLLLATAVGLDWRAAVLVSLVAPLLARSANRGTLVEPSRGGMDTAGGRLPPIFWVAGGMLMCATAAEWCITAWGATFVQQALDSSPDRAVAVMAGYFGGVLAGRVLGSRLTRRHDPSRLFALALAVALVGFVVAWPSTTPLPSTIGMALLGTGVGNLFPLGLSIAVSVAPQHAAAASGRVVLLTSTAILLAPLTVGTLAEATSLEAALTVVPVLVVLAAVALQVIRRARRRDLAVG